MVNFSRFCLTRSSCCPEASGQHPLEMVFIKALNSAVFKESLFSVLHLLICQSTHFYLEHLYFLNQLQAVAKELDLPFDKL
jgi:hypothetical protein